MGTPIYAETIDDQSRAYRPYIDDPTRIKGTMVPRAVDGRGGGSTGFDPNRLLPYVVDPGMPDGNILVDPYALAAVDKDGSAHDVYKRASTLENVVSTIEVLPQPQPQAEAKAPPVVHVDGSNNAAGVQQLISKLGGPQVKTAKIEKPKVEKRMSDQPAIKVVFVGSFGELETYYHEASVQNNSMVLIWDKRFVGSKYTPPKTMADEESGIRPEALTVILDNHTYRVWNFNLKFDIKSANLEVLVLPIAESEG